MGDPSFDNVLAPEMLRALGTQATAVLDAGCGVGRFTARVAAIAENVVGIDPSSVSAELAASHLRMLPNVRIENLSIQEYADSAEGAHEFCLAMMVLQDVVDLRSFLNAAARVLRHGGRLVAAVTNPDYWPRYWGYEDSDWFDPSRELYIRSEFRTSLRSSGVATLHVHRPKTMYLAELAEAGFASIATWEPMMSEAAQKRTEVSWTFPHFWFFSGVMERR